VQYLVLIHAEADSEASPDEWQAFFTLAEESGLFRGGSAVGQGLLLGRPSPHAMAGHLGGFMRFDADDRAALLDLLARHPLVVHGGTIEVLEMPKD
jgi:hypothetical protein